jgi:hypothetical protein
MIVNFYTTLGCHLCEQALVILKQCIANDAGCTIVEIEIADDTDLLEKYGLIIPVVNVVGREGELGWPFNHQDLADFLKL